MSSLKGDPEQDEHASLPTAEQKRLAGVALSKLVAASIGDIVVLLSRSPTHKHLSLADIEWLVLPAVAVSQFYVAEYAHKDKGFRSPAAVVTWARVSDDVDQRLRAPSQTRIQLQPDEWTSGENYWLIDLAGAPQALGSALDYLNTGPLKDKTVFIAARDDSGKVKVEILSEIVQHSKQFATEKAK